LKKFPAVYNDAIHLTKPSPEFSTSTSSSPMPITRPRRSQVWSFQTSRMWRVCSRWRQCPKRSYTPSWSCTEPTASGSWTRLWGPTL